ncbi:MAG TPA: hypothetical protein V6C71_24315 [Coleofasciculaceae cyanobacterium]|jgi:hypothetical protein
MSQIEAKFVATDTTFRVKGYEKIEYELLFKEGVFNPQTRDELLKAAVYKLMGTCYLVNDSDQEASAKALAKHRRICAEYPDAELRTQVCIINNDK